MKQRPFNLRKAAAYAPLTCLSVTTAVSWTVFLAGGANSIYAWLSLLGLLPLLSLLMLVGTLIATWITRKRPRAAADLRRARWRLSATVVLGAFGIWPALWNVGIATLPYPFTLAETRPVVKARLPTDVAMRVVWGGDSLAHNYHASLPDQRWAYDLAVEPTLVGSARLADYGCFGVPVVAPVAGVVRVAHDGEPDRAPTPGSHETNFEAPLGNHVAIAVEGGGYVVVAHLKQGSVVVRPDQRIDQGSPIGACGNSGNTSEPHVHIHAQRQDPRERPINFAEGLPLVFEGHDGADMPRGGIRIVDGRPVATGAIVRHLNRGAPAPLSHVAR